MAKTLADMTAEERADCVGMWCDNLVSTADNPHPVVLACAQGKQWSKTMSNQVARLQAAVREMLADINVDAAEKLSGFDGYDGQDVVSIEDYGLTQEDME